MQGSFNTHLIALCCIAFVVVAAFLLFDLDDKLFQNTPKEYAANLSYVEAPNHTVTADSTTIDANLNKVSEKPIQQKPTLPKPAQKAQKEPKSRLFDLESRQFKLDLSGDARIGQSNMAKKTTLMLTMIPIKGTNLQEFKIVDSRFVLDGTSVFLSNTGVKINDGDLILSLIAEQGAYQIHGTMDKTIIDSKTNKQNVIFNDQTIYLTKKDVPYLLNLRGTLSS